MKKTKGAIISFEVTDDGSLKLLNQKTKEAGKGLKNVGKNAGDVRRNMQAMSGRVESGTKGFARMQQGTGGLVQSYAILASTLFAVGAAFRALQNAANVENQIKGFRSLAAITGESMMGVTAAVRAATGGLLNFQDAAQQSAIATAAGFTQTQIAGLAEGAKIASVTLGRDLTDSFNRLIRGVTKAEPELLDELGIILRLDIATRKFANANGLIAEKLTISQRRAAVFEEVQRQLIANFGAMDSEADKLLNPFDRLMTKINDFVISIQGPIVGVFGGIADFLSENFGALVTAVTMFGMSILKQIVPSFQQMGASAVAAGNTAKQRIKDLEKDITKQKSAIKSVEKQFKVSEVKKNQVFKQELKRRGITLKQFTAMSLKEQKKLVASIIADEKRGVTHTKKTNKQRLASYQAVFKRIQLESKRTQMTLAAHAQVAGAQIRMALVKPLIQVQGALAGVGAAAARLAPVFATLGAIVNAAFALIMAFFTAKFIVDLLPITKRINASFNDINERTTVLNETVTDLAHTIGSDLHTKRIESIKETFGGLEGNVRAANYELTRLNNLLNRGSTGENFIKELEESITKNFGQGQETSLIGNLFSFSPGAGRKGFESKAYQAEVKNVILQLQSIAMKEFEALKTMDSNNTGFELGMFDSIFATAGKAEEAAAFKEAFAEIMEMPESTARQAALATLLQDTASALSDTYKEGMGFLQITAEGNVIITDTTRELLRLGDIGVDSFSNITSVIPNVNEAAKQLKETIQNIMPKPSAAESVVSSIDALLNQFVDSNGLVKQFDLTEEKMASIVTEMETMLGISFDVTGTFQEQATAVKEILEDERARLDLADELIDTAAAFNSVLKAQTNMVSFLNTTASKRMKDELKILDLKEKQVQNLAKYEVKNSEELVKLAGEVEENRKRELMTALAINQELQTQINLLYAMQDPIERMSKTLLEAFDSGGVKSLTKLFDTMNLGEYGGKEMVADMAKEMKSSLAKDMAQGLMTKITTALTPDAYKLNKDLTPAEMILAAHQQHIKGLADVLDQHVKAMGMTGGVSAPSIVGNDITEMKKGDLYGGFDSDNPLAGGFREALQNKLGPIGKFLFGSNNFGNQGMGYSPGGAEGGIDDVTAYGQKNDPGFFGTSGGTDLFNIKAMFNDIFGLDGVFHQTGMNLFGGKESVFGKLGNSLFGEGGALSKMFGGGEGGFMGGLGQMFGSMGKAGGGMLSGLFGGGGGGGGIMALLKPLLSMIPGIGPLLSILPFAKGGIIGNKVVGLERGGVARYAKGGVATQPTYLVGEGKQNEAVVPLPDNKSIPVDLGRGAGNENNVSISVNMADGSTNTKADAQQGKQLGAAINAAVLRELERQQRPGGMLQAQG